MLSKLNLIVRENGASAVLPQNLSDEMLDHILMETEFFNNVLKGNDLDLDGEVSGASCLIFCIIIILKHQKNNPDSFEIDEKEFMNSIDLYSIAIAAEEVTRKTEIKIDSTTLDNIFDDKRKLSFHKCDDI